MTERHLTCVITSIFPPSDGVRAFEAKAEIDRLIVVGDKKTPGDWACGRVDFWSLERQLDECGEIARRLPVNHYCRKNIGYLVAAERSDLVYDTDDDNLPNAFWGVPSLPETVSMTEPGQGFVNVYKYFSDDLIWPRGFPLDGLQSGLGVTQQSGAAAQVPIWQGLADNDPDVDAVYRMVTGRTGTAFRREPPLLLTPGSYSPFNSQNTFFSREAFALLYLPVTVTMRFTDILRSYVALAVVESFGWTVGFFSATVYQERNEHDLMRDFADEVPMYLHCRAAMQALVEACAAQGGGVEDRLLHCYEALADMQIVEPEEIGTLTAWLDELSARRSKAG